MDPASVAIGVVSGAAALALMAVQTTTYLMGIKDTFQQANLIFHDLVTCCQTFETAWNQIHEWASAHPSRPNESTQVFEKLGSYLEASKVMLDSLRADLERFSPKDKTSLFSRRKAIYIHEKLLRGHCERLHRQISSLHLLLSAAKLPSIEMQNFVVDVFQPVFRKDEETAWTIVQSKQSTRPPPSTKYSESVRSALQKHETVEHSGPKFTFENDLFLSPVYKRLLLRSLSAPDPIEECSPQEQSSVLTGEIRAHGVGNGPEIRVDDASSFIRPSTPDEFALTPNNIINTLRSVGDFSAGVQVDLQELRQTMGCFNLPKRSLPLHSALKRAQMEPEVQLHLNEQLLRAAVQDDEGLVAEALDNGADINTTGIDGNSALDISLKHDDLASHIRQGYSIVVELLLLYRETTLTSKSRGKGTILHLAILSGNVATVACLSKDCKTELQSMICQDAPQLYVAPAFSHQDILPFRAINHILASNLINPDHVSKYEGKSALHLAAIEGDWHLGATLVGVGCNPYAPMQDPNYNGNRKEPYGSALFFATKLEHGKFVRSVLDEFLKQEKNLKSANSRYDDTLELVQIAEHDGFGEIAETLLSKWLDWPRDLHMETRLFFSLVSSAPSHDQAALLLALLAKGFIPDSTLNISKLVPLIWAICDEDWAVSVVKGRMPMVGDTLPYRPVVYCYGQATDWKTYGIEDLLVQILYARGRAWAHAGRRGEVRKGDTSFGPPHTDEARSSRIRDLLGTRTWYTWKGDEVTRGMSEHELCYVLDDPNRWLPNRQYFFPDASGNPYLVLDAWELLLQYVAWVETGPLDERRELRKRRPSYSEVDTNRSYNTIGSHIRAVAAQASLATSSHPLVRELLRRILPPQHHIRQSSYYSLVPNYFGQTLHESPYLTVPSFASSDSQYSSMEF